MTIENMRLNRVVSQERIGSTTKDRDQQSLNTDLSGIMPEATLTASRSARDELGAQLNPNQEADRKPGARIAIQYTAGTQQEGYLSAVQQPADWSSGAHTKRGSRANLAPVYASTVEELPEQTVIGKKRAGALAR